MRQGQQNRRGRGRGTTNNSSNTNNRKAQSPLSRSFESNGPDVKIRGTAAQIAEKYMTLARDASSSGDTVMSENYFQHAEHYNRIIMAAQQAQTVQNAQPGAHNGSDAGHAMNGAQRPQREGNSSGMREQPQPQHHSDPQPRSEAQPQQQQSFEAQADQPSEDQPQPAPKAGPVEEAQDDESGKNSAGAEASAEGSDTGRRRRRRYPGGTDSGSAPAAEKKPGTRKSTKAAPASNEDQPTDEATA